MRYLSFNPNKSLQTESLVFDDSIIIKGFYAINNFALISVPIIFGLAFAFIQWHFRHPAWFPLSIICLCFGLFCSYFIFLQIRKSLYFRKIITPHKRRNNLNWMKEICRLRNWAILKSDNHCQVIKLEDYKFGSTHTGKELFLLYHENTVYLRILTYSNFDRVSPFHWKSQRKLEDDIIDIL